VSPLARAAAAIGADGLLVEVHPVPDEAWSDGKQSLTFAQFDQMMQDLEPYLALRERSQRGKLELITSRGGH